MPKRKLDQLEKENVLQESVINAFRAVVKKYPRNEYAKEILGDLINANIPSDDYAGMIEFIDKCKTHMPESYFALEALRNRCEQDLTDTKPDEPSVYKKSK